MKKNKIELDLELIHLNEKYKIHHIKTNPPRLEAKIVFDKEDISQKLIFTLMNLSHKHGFACSSPRFRPADDPSMSFLIGTILPDDKTETLEHYSARLLVCLDAITDFADEFVRQLDFSCIDISMFEPAYGVCSTDLAAVRDQYYEGSWSKFKTDLLNEGREEEAEILSSCMEFESLNNKDVGFVGHKLDSLLDFLYNRDAYFAESN